MNTNRRKRKLEDRAFTLLEVLMVVVILGLLAAFVVPNLFGTRQKAERDITQSVVNSGFSNALDLYKLHMGHYPLSDEGGLQQLLEPPDDEAQAKKWAGPYVKPKDLKDPWGRDYIYVCPGNVNETTYDLSSAGPDGQEGTEDDICNWEKT